MTRCIHCTRCVRFSSEISGTFELGTTGRGGSTEIGPYISSFIRTEMSGNLIDICPVGALTSKPYAFKARPWELKKTTSVDVFDSLGSYITVETRGNDILRITPSYSESDPEGWITDKVRFSFDSITKQRILYPLSKENGMLTKTSWRRSILKSSLYLRGAHRLTTSQMAFVSHDESRIIKRMLLGYGFSFFLSNDYDFRHMYLCDRSVYNSNINEAETVFLMYTGIKQKMPLLNVMLKKKKKKKSSLYAAYVR